MLDTGSTNGFVQSILARIVLYLKLGDTVGAERAYKDGMKFEDFLMIHYHHHQLLQLFISNINSY